MDLQSGFCVALAAGDELGDGVMLELISLGPIRGGWLGRVAENAAAGVCGEGLEEGVADAFVHVDATISHARLARVPHDAVLGFSGRLFNVRVLEDEGGRLAAEFKNDFFEVRPGSCDLNRPSHPFVLQYIHTYIIVIYTWVHRCLKFQQDFPN